jgi:hypothetical protein
VIIVICQSTYEVCFGLAGNLWLGLLLGLVLLKGFRLANLILTILLGLCKGLILLL